MLIKCLSVSAAELHSSKSLIPTESKYSQIEKLLQLFSQERNFTKCYMVVTDHKPLISIFGSKKGIPVYTANGLQRWAPMHLYPNFSIKYQPGSKIGQADALSRLISSNQKATEDRVINGQHYSILVDAYSK